MTRNGKGTNLTAVPFRVPHRDQRSSRNRTGGCGGNQILQLAVLGFARLVRAIERHSKADVRAKNFTCFS